MPGSLYDYARSPSPVRRTKTPRAYTSMACMDQRNVWSPDLVADSNIAAGMYTDHYTAGDRWRNVDDIRMEDDGMNGYLPAVSPGPSPRPQAPSPHRGRTPRNPSPTYEAELDNYNSLSMMMPFQDPRARLHSSYTRRIRNHRDVSPPRVKSGRAGGSWRHISQTNGHQGNNILFIEGTVKQADSSNFPPYGWVAEDQGAFMHYVSPRMIPRQRPVEQKTRVPKATNYTSYYNNHARKGFKYWYQEKKPKGSSAPLNSIQSRLLSLRT